jgi:hypothetical protein
MFKFLINCDGHYMLKKYINVNLYDKKSKNVVFFTKSDRYVLTKHAILFKKNFFYEIFYQKHNKIHGSNILFL